jgi:threonine aldolase
VKLLLKFLGFLFLLSIVFYSYARLVEPALLTVKYENIYSSYIDDNIKINGLEGGEYRFVTHIGISKEDIDYVIACMKELILK